MSQFAHYSDEQLFQHLKSLGFSPGPITPSTRLVHEKRLANYLREGAIPSQPATRLASSQTRSSPSPSRNNRSTESPRASPNTINRSPSSMSDQELYEHMKSLGLNPGPITPSTRSTYEKKLASYMKTVMVPGQPGKMATSAAVVDNESPTTTRVFSAAAARRISPNTISGSPSSMSDQELFEHMKSLGLNPGPITPTTRSTYEKKLASYMTMVKIPGQPGKMATSAAVVDNESPTTTRVFRAAAASRVSSPRGITTKVSPTLVVPVQVRVHVEQDQVGAGREDRSVPIKKTNRPSGKYGLRASNKQYDEDDDDDYTGYDDDDDDNVRTNWKAREPPKPATAPPLPPPPPTTRTPDPILPSSVSMPTPSPTPAPKVHQAKDFPLEFKLLSQNFTPPDVNTSMSSSPSSSSLGKNKSREEHSFSTYSFMRTNNFNSIPNPVYHPTNKGNKYHESYLDNMNTSREHEKVIDPNPLGGVKKRNLLPFDPKSLQPQEHHHHYHHHHQYGAPLAPNVSTSSGTSSHLYPDLSMYQQHSSSTSSIYNQPAPLSSSQTTRFGNHHQSIIARIKSSSVYRYISQNCLYALLAIFFVALIYNFLMNTPTDTQNPLNI